MTRLLPLLFVAACSSSNTGAVVDAYDAILTDMGTLNTDHADAVGSATTLDQITTLESSFQTDWSTMHASMTAQMDTIGMCGMNDAAMGTMTDSNTLLADMDGLVTDHVAAHADHTDIIECTASEDTLTSAMTTRMDTMIQHGEDWRTSMHCKSDMAGM